MGVLPSCSCSFAHVPTGMTLWLLCLLAFGTHLGHKGSHLGHLVPPFGLHLDHTGTHGHPKVLNWGAFGRSDRIKYDPIEVRSDQI